MEIQVGGDTARAACMAWGASCMTWSAACTPCLPLWYWPHRAHGMQRTPCGPAWPVQQAPGLDARRVQHLCLCRRQSITLVTCNQGCSVCCRQFSDCAGERRHRRPEGGLCLRPAGEGGEWASGRGVRLGAWFHCWEASCAARRTRQRVAVWWDAHVTLHPSSARTCSRELAAQPVSASSCARHLRASLRPPPPAPPPLPRCPCRLCSTRTR